MRPRWNSGPAGLVLVRHGESEGNLADMRARQAGAERLELDIRDADVELSATGRDQAAALNRWLGEQRRRRAADAWRSARRTSGPPRPPGWRWRATTCPLVLDERLRERDLGRSWTG